MSDTEPPEGTEWAPIPEFETAYSAGKDGRIWSHHTGQVLTPYLNSRARGEQYYRVDLRDDGRRRQAYVHHLVLEAHEGKRSEGHHAHHVNSDQQDNRLANLEWIEQESHMNGHHEETERTENGEFAPVDDGAPF